MKSIESADAFKFIQEIAADLSKGSVVFPTSFNTTMKLRELLRSENSSLGDLVAIAALDPLLAARLLQVANSTAFNPGGSAVRDLRSAVMRLGVANVRALALSVAMQQLRTYKEMQRFDSLCERFMQHSRQVAAVAFVIAREHTSLPPETALFAGLVHDVGLFYLLYRIALRHDLDLDSEGVQQLLNDWHGSIGQAVLSALGVPEDILQAIDRHDQPRRIDKLGDLGDLLFVGNQLVMRDGPESAKLAWLDDALGESLIRDIDQYLATMAAKRDEIQAIARLV